MYISTVQTQTMPENLTKQWWPDLTLDPTFVWETFAYSFTYWNNGLRDVNIGPKLFRPETIQSFMDLNNRVSKYILHW